MTRKVRRIDWSPDEYIAGCFGRLTTEEHGLYGVVLNLIYSRGGPVDCDLSELARYCCSRPQAMRRILDKLLAKRKLRLTVDGKLANGRADVELGKAAVRIEDARRAGRASGDARRRSADHRRIIAGSPADQQAVSEKRSRDFNGVTRTPVRNYQPSTESSLSDSESGAARDPARDAGATGRAPGKPDPKPAAPAPSPKTAARLAELAKASRDRLLKGG